MRATSPSGNWQPDSHGLKPGSSDGRIHVPGHHDASPTRSESKKWAILRITPTDQPFLIGWHHADDHRETQFYIELDRRQRPKSALTDSHGCLAIQIGHSDVVFVARPLRPNTRLSINLESVQDTGDIKINEMPHY